MSPSIAFPPPPGDKHQLEEGLVFSPKFDANGLIPAIVSDVHSGDVLMFAYMNAESLALSLQTGEAHYWSRSRGKLWRKGETSGHVQKIVELRTDCDQDCLWLKVDTQGAAACHVGYQSCFYRAVIPPTGAQETASTPPGLQLVIDKKSFDPAKVYGKD